VLYNREVSKNSSNSMWFFYKRVGVFQALFVIIAMLFSLIISFFTANDLRDNRPSSEQLQAQRIQKLEDEATALHQKLDVIQKSLRGKSTDLNLKSLDARTTQLEQKEEALSQTILNDADKALTARLLREKQKELENSLNEIKEDGVDLKEKFYDITTKMILAQFGTIIILIAGVLLNNYLISYLQKHKNNDGNK
jgi:hypothetical protein